MCIRDRYWRTVPINDQLSAFLKDLKKRSKGGYSQKVWKWSDKRDKKITVNVTGFVLPHFSQWKTGMQAEILRTFCEGIGITSVKFHTLRACFATQLIKDSVAPAVVMKIAGWKDLQTMQRYVRLAGIDVKGATDTLQVIPSSEAMGKVVNLFPSK